METRTKEIDGREYKIILPPARQGMSVCTKTATLLGPIFASMGMEIKEDGKSKKKEEIINHLSAALAQAEPEKVDQLLLEAVNISHLHCNNSPVFSETDFDRHFTMYKGDIFPVTGWVLMQVVADFFPWLANFGQMVEKVKGEVFPSPKDGK